MDHARDLRFVEPHDDAFRHCRYGRQAPRLAGQTALAKEIPLVMDCDDRFLPLLGNNVNLDLALLHEKDRVRRISLAEDRLALSIFRYAPAPVHGGEKRFDVEGRL